MVIFIILLNAGMHMSSQQVPAAECITQTDVYTLPVLWLVQLQPKQKYLAYERTSKQR